MKNLRKIGRYITKLLRHDPENLIMNNEGYVLVDDLLEKLDIDINELDWIVDNNNKKRFSYLEDKTLIRASQGHNKKLKVSIDMKVSGRVEYLYHGTSSKFVESILKNGLSPMSRNHVHLSIDKETATQVGLRKSKDIVILTIDSARMRADNIKIYISDNNVYLTDYVDPKYINV